MAAYRLFPPFYGSFPRMEKIRNLVPVDAVVQAVIIELFRGKRHVSAPFKALLLC